MAETKTHRLRGEQMRGKILEAAKNQFASRGYVGASLNAIAVEAGITQPGLLHHFKSKEELFQDVLREQRNDDDVLLLAASRSGVQGVRAFISTVKALPEHPDIAHLYHVLVGESQLEGVPIGPYVQQRYSDLIDGLAAGLRAGQSDGTIRKDADIDAAVAVLIGASDGLRTQFLLNPDLDYVAAMNLVADLILTYVSPKPAEDA